MLRSLAARWADLSTRSDGESRAMSLQDAFAMGLDVSGRKTGSGQDVNRETALTLSAVYGCWRIISDNVGTLDLEIFQDREQGLTNLPESNAAFPEWLLFDDPSKGPGRIAFLTACVLSFLSDGNLFLATSRDTDGTILNIRVLDPTKVTILRNKARGRHFEVDGRKYSVLDIHHIPGMILPGAERGISPLHYARESVGIGLATQEYGAVFFRQGAMPGALIEHDGPVSNTGIAQMKRAWRDIHEGSGNAHKVAVLTEGATFKAVSLSPDDAQFLETRQFTIADVARFYGVPPHLLADASQSTSWGSGLAEQNLTFGQHALRPWVARLNEGLTYLIRSDGPRGRKFRPVVRLDLEGATRGSMKEQVETLGRGIQFGIFSQNEARRRLGLSPIPDPSGDEVIVHLSTTTQDDEPGEETPAPDQPEEGDTP